MLQLDQVQDYYLSKADRERQEKYIAFMHRFTKSRALDWNTGDNDDTNEQRDIALNVTRRH